MSDHHEAPGAHHLRPPPGETFGSSEGLRRRVAALEEVAQTLVTQVEEFHAGFWDEKDWPAALDALTRQAEAARAALRGTTP